MNRTIGQTIVVASQCRQYTFSKLAAAGQDLPPPGGFDPIQYKRHLPKRGPSGWMLLAGSMAIIIGSTYIHSKGVRISKELDREKRQGRLAILPLLVAESDLQTVKRERENMEMEERIMRNVPGWVDGETGQQPKIYHSGRYVPPTFSLSDYLSK